jgi:hypothetical protein
MHQKMLVEMRVTNTLLKEGLNIREELESFREHERIQPE